MSSDFRNPLSPTQNGWAGILPKTLPMERISPAPVVQGHRGWRAVSQLLSIFYLLHIPYGPICEPHLAFFYLHQPPNSMKPEVWAKGQALLQKQWWVQWEFGSLAYWHMQLSDGLWLCPGLTSDGRLPSQNTLLLGPPDLGLGGADRSQLVTGSSGCDDHLKSQGLLHHLCQGPEAFQELFFRHIILCRDGLASSRTPRVYIVVLLLGHSINSIWYLLALQILLISIGSVGSEGLNITLLEPQPGPELFPALGTTRVGSQWESSIPRCGICDFQNLRPTGYYASFLVVRGARCSHLSFTLK